MAQGENKRHPLEEGLVAACRAIDNQIAREMQRTPAERELHGVLKSEPYAARVERVTAFLLNALGDEEVKLDSLLVLATSFAKALQITAEDLGADGLGKVRTEYCRDVFEQVSRIARSGKLALSDPDSMT